MPQKSTKLKPPATVECTVHGQQSLYTRSENFQRKHKQLRPDSNQMSRPTEHHHFFRAMGDQCCGSGSGAFLIPGSE
jgi:hypothetical protein